LQPRLRLFLVIGCLAPDHLLPQARVDPVPEGPPAVVSELSPFRGAPDSARVADLLVDEAKRSGFPASDHDHVLAARLWRRAGETELAIKSLGAIPTASAAADLAAYETARLMFEAGRDVAGGGAYWSVCRSSDERVRAEIAWDQLPVSTPEEREAWGPSRRVSRPVSGFAPFGTSGPTGWPFLAMRASPFTIDGWLARVPRCGSRARASIVKLPTSTVVRRDCPLTIAA
jgi:hypothetical protein